MTNQREIMLGKTTHFIWAHGTSSQINYHGPNRGAASVVIAAAASESLAQSNCDAAKDTDGHGSPASPGIVIGIIFGLLLPALGVGGFIWYRWRRGRHRTSWKNSKDTRPEAPAVAMITIPTEKVTANQANEAGMGVLAAAHAATVASACAPVEIETCRTD